MQPHRLETLEAYIPFDLLEPVNALIAFFAIYLVILFRYFLLAGGFHLVFYTLRPGWTQARQIYKELPSTKEMLFEIRWSALTSLIFAGVGLGIGIAWQQGWTQIYLRFDEYGWWYLIMSPLLVAVIHDAYFYFVHRLMHVRWFYVRMHHVHHASLRPSPWASFSFHPWESVVEALILPLLILLLPLHPIVLLWHLTFMTLTAVINHLGFEVLPRSGARHPLFKWLITGSHHAQHHRHFNSNYALFFTYLDHLFGTQRVDYPDSFDRAFQHSAKSSK